MLFLNSFVSFLYHVVQIRTQCWRRGRTAQSRVGQSSPLPISSAGSGAPQGTVGPLGCQGALLVQVQLAVSQNTYTSYLWVSLQSPTPQSVHISRAGQSQDENLAFAFIKIYEMVIPQPSDLSSSVQGPSAVGESAAPPNLVLSTKLIHTQEFHPDYS